MTRAETSWTSNTERVVHIYKKKSDVSCTIISRVVATIIIKRRIFMAPVFRSTSGIAIPKPTVEQVEEAIKENRNYIRAAISLQVSPRQLRYLRKLYYIERKEISDEALEEEVRVFYTTTAISNGEENFIGHLRAKGLKVRRKRTRVARRAYSEEFHDYRRYRRDTAMRRRVYTVPGVNFMWHGDG